MFRRCVSLLLIAGFLVGQLAAIPHAHGAASGESQREHDAAPHFHVAWLGHAAHGHDHSHGEKRHSHSGQARARNSQRSSDSSSDRPSVARSAGDSHDADAVFVSEQVVAASRSRVQVVSAGEFAALAPHPAGVANRSTSPAPSPRWHPPDKVLDASDTYLTLRNLRI